MKALNVLVSDFLNASTSISSDSGTKLVDSKLSMNKTQDMALSTSLWSDLQPLQEIVTPSPVEPASTDLEDGFEEFTDTNETETATTLKQDTDVVTELKDDIPVVDKFVRAGE